MLCGTIGVLLVSMCGITGVLLVSMCGLIGLLLVSLCGILLYYKLNIVVQPTTTYNEFEADLCDDLTDFVVAELYGRFVSNV